MVWLVDADPTHERIVDISDGYIQKEMFNSEMNQISMDGRGSIHDKIQTAINRLQMFEPEEGYYVAFSGGKDSQCVYHLCKMAGVKFDAHYAVTSVDPPELVQFIKSHYPDVAFERQYYKDDKPRHYFNDGRPKPITMWSLIADNTMPPTRHVRYCCDFLKERGGVGRVTVTGVRWAESVRRRGNRGIVEFQNKPKSTIKIAERIGAEYKLNKSGGVIMNDDNDEARRLVEQCYRTRKTIVNPIIDWSDDDVWEFLNSSGIEHCSLYDEGFERLGCIGCPLTRPKNRVRDFERWPKYKELYVLAFKRMIENHPGRIKILNPNDAVNFNPSGLGGEPVSVLCNEVQSGQAEKSNVAIRQAKPEDARWMLDDIITSEDSGLMWGLNKASLSAAETLLSM